MSNVVPELMGRAAPSGYDNNPNQLELFAYPPEKSKACPISEPKPNLSSSQPQLDPDLHFHWLQVMAEARRSKRLPPDSLDRETFLLLWEAISLLSEIP